MSFLKSASAIKLSAFPLINSYPVVLLHVIDNCLDASENLLIETMSIK